MYKQHFGLKHAPLEKETTLLNRQSIEPLQQRFQWLLQSPGIGLLTGAPGVGKTSAMRILTQDLNPNKYHIVYSPDTDFTRMDIYRNLAEALGLEPAYRRAQLWNEVKQCIVDMVEQKHIQPIWIIDEAQNLPYEFFHDLPSFLNICFDSKMYMTVWLIGTPLLEAKLCRPHYETLHSRISAKAFINPIEDPEQFKQVIEQSLKDAGCHQQLIASSGISILRQAAKGIPRKAGRIIKLAMQIAAEKKINHLPDDLIQQATDELKL